MRTLSILVLLMFGAYASKAQDPNFSQFFASPLTLNPALTGKFDGNIRVAGNYRNQWPSINNAFITSTASIDFNILQNRIPEIDQFGFGVLAMTDRSGNGVLQANYLAVSLAYHKGLDEDGYHQLGLGFQGAYTNKRLDVGKATFEDMLRANGFTGLTGETFAGSQLNVSYFDLNAGLLYTGTTNGENQFYLGASAYHLNSTRETFDSNQYYLKPRVTLQGGGMLPLANGNQFHFSALHSRQANAMNTVFGGAYMLSLSPEPAYPTNLFIGSWYRLNDAIIPYVGLEYGNFTFGASYDVNTSGLKPGSNMRGGIEISLIYIKRSSDPNLRRLNCPRF
jgi:type IX secretion system PorP/SprF family membrane protein